MIQFAEKSMVPALKEIWRRCFGDEEGYISLYFDRRFRPEETLVYLNHGLPVGMLAMLPCEIVTDRGTVASRYVYGVATLPEYQGRGYSSALLEYAHRWMRKHEILVSVLVPAEESLFQFYRKRGYLPTFSVRQVRLSREEILHLAQQGPALQKPLTLEEVTAKEFYALREEFFSRQGLFVRWDEQALSYVMEENQFQEGKILRFSTDYGHGYVVCYKIKNKIAVKECGARDETMVCRALLSAFDEDLFELRLAADSPLFMGLGEKREFAAAVYLGEVQDRGLLSLSERLTGRELLDAPYCNLVLD